MKEKHGFVFIETIIVIVVAMVLLVSIYSSFSLILTNINRKEKYDNINDIYKANIVSRLFTSYTIGADYVEIDETNCSSYMNSDCANVLSDLGINDIFINDISYEDILISEPDLPSTLISYLNNKAIEENTIIIHCIRNGEDYYASIIFKES